MSPDSSVPADNKATSNSTLNLPEPSSSAMAQSSERSTQVAAEPTSNASTQQNNMATTHDFLAALNVDIRSQEDQEREVAAKLAELHKKAEDERDQKLIEKTLAKIEQLATKKRSLEAQLGAPALNFNRRTKIADDIEDLVEQHRVLHADLLVTQDRMKTREQEHAAFKTDVEVDYSQVAKPGESKEQFLVRTGKITPFALAKSKRHQPQNELEEELRAVEDEDELKKQAEIISAEPQSHQHLQKPGFEPAKIDYSTISAKKRPSTRNDTASKKRPTEHAANGASKRARTPDYVAGNELVTFDHTADEAQHLGVGGSVALSQVSTPDESDASFVENDAVEQEDESSEDFNDVIPEKKQKKGSRKSKADEDVVKITDDGDEKAYQRRLKAWTEARSGARQETESEEEIEVDNRAEWLKDSPAGKGHTMEGGITIPGDIYGVLFDYQKVGVQWLSELYSQGMGGILADEMGLGKTIQVITMIASLHHSGELTKPVLIVCPATVMQQWVNEFHDWWPALRVSILHSTGAGMINLREESRHDADFDYDARSYRTLPKAQRAAKGIVNRVLEKGHVLVTTYSGLETYHKLITEVEWQYAVLDEGHKIKNPDTAVTLLCKNLTTRNRIILSGTPMQNNMTEIWSLMDFVHPGILGTLVDFKINFEEPINRGHHKSCTNLERKIAENTATVLKNTISQQLLQRYKVDVASDLPKKTEQTLCCKFTVSQAKAYRQILASDEVARAKSGRAKPMEIIDKLKKICNHPDLLHAELRSKEGYNWGDPDKSGKMEVTKQLIQMWKAKGEKMLLFSQGKQMMVILEKALKSMGNIRYLVMHGETQLSKRSVLVEQFQNDPEIDVFLLSTGVGGLGLNLTAANGVIIFDPSWNPATDSQARERSWRLGQKKPVTVFRLMCKGAIEEKMYQRQLYKTKLTEKVLKDATSQNTFDPKDLQDLFSYDNDDEQNGKASDYTQGAERRIEADWSGDGKYNTERIENGTALEMDGAAQARYAMDPKTFKRNAIGLEAIAKEKSNKRKLDDDWGVQSPSGPVTDKNGVSLDTPPPDAKRQKMAQLEAEQWDTLEQVKGISGVKDMYRTRDVDDEVPSQQKTLDNIFALSGIHSVLEHDAILRGKKVQPDMRYINADAEKLKKETEAIIRRNAEAAKIQRAGTVTWTGRHGEAGRRQIREQTESRNRWRVGGSRSANSTANPARNPSRFQTRVLGAARSREATPGSRGATPDMPPPARPQQKVYHDRIRAFIRAQGGNAPTEMVANHFDHTLKNDLARDPNARNRFIDEIKAMCELSGGMRGRGGRRWVLRAQYR